MCPTCPHRRHVGELPLAFALPFGSGSFPLPLAGYFTRVELPLPFPFFALVLPLPRPGETGDKEEDGEAGLPPSVNATIGRYPLLSLISLKRRRASMYDA